MLHTIGFLKEERRSFWAYLRRSTIRLSLPEPRRFFLDVHFENLVGFLKVKSIKVGMLPLHLNCDLHEFLTLKIVHNSASSNLSKFPLGCSYQAVPLEASAPWKQILVDSLHLLISPDFGDFPGGSDSKASAYNAGDPGLIPKILWRRKWHPTPVLLPGISHGQRSLVGYSLWGHKELDTIE